jgi:hypothetical protein
MEDMRSVYSILVGKPEGKIPFGRSWRTWEDNIKNGCYGNSVEKCRLSASTSE